jgi:hypothetical protein
MLESSEDELTLSDASDDASSGRPDVEPNYGDACRLEGRYEVDPIPGAKRFQGVWLVLDDWTRYVIAYRPVREQFQFINKRVLIQGRPYLPGSDTQHIKATHLAIDSIELAPGEEAYDEVPQGVPLPPVVRTAEELATCVGRWVRLIGTLEGLEEDPESYLGIATMKLADGSVIRTWGVVMKSWAKLQNRKVTVISRVERVKNEPALTGWYAFADEKSDE